MDLGALGCQGWRQEPDATAPHYRYTWHGNKNKIPGLSKLFLVSLHEKHGFQGFSSHLNSKTDILVFQRLWKKKILSLLYILECVSRAGCISFGAAELHQFAQGRELLFPNRPWGELWPANQARISLDPFQDANTAFFFLLEILKLNDLVRRSFLPALVMGLLRDYLDYQVAFSVYQWPQDQSALLENKQNSCLQ